MTDRIEKLRKRRIALLYGGPSAERKISIKSAGAVRQALKRLGLPFAAVDLTPDVAGALRRAKTDLAFLVTHGSVGEDGRLQGLLDVMGIPYTGSGVLASALAMHKPSAKVVFESCGLPTAPWVSLRRGDERPKLSLPLVVKPASQGSAVGVYIVKKPGRLSPALEKVWRLDREALLEKYLPGVEITVGILDGRALPVVEIVPAHDFYDFHSKYAPGGSRHLVPARLPESLRRRAQEIALAAHKVLGCRHMSRVDLIVHKKTPMILEVNTLPGFTDTSLLPDAARAAGISFDQLVLRLLQLALRDA